MPIRIRPLHPLFAAEIEGVDAGGPPDAATFAELRAALDEYSVLVLPNQPLDDERQIAFSEMFGPLEMSNKANLTGGTAFARQSNLDTQGRPMAADTRSMLYQKANQLWHSDSSFKAVPSLCSILSGRIVPPEGGDTEFATMRGAWDGLPAEMKAKVDGLVAWHSLEHSRSIVAPDVLPDEVRAALPPVRQVMVRVNPANGRKALYVGSHASHVEGMPREEGAALIAELIAHATRPEYIYRHRWRPDDLLIWDNRAVLHRATPFDTSKQQRLMQRTTVAGDAPTVPQ